MAKQKLFKAGLGLLGLYFRHSGVFPVDPGDRKSEISALRLSVELAKKGRGVCVFPQGTRMPPGQIRKQDANSGMSYIAVKAGVPIVPMLIVYQTWGVTVQFGSPVSSDNREELTEKVVKALNVLRQSADRGRS